MQQFATKVVDGKHRIHYCTIGDDFPINVSELQSTVSMYYKPPPPPTRHKDFSDSQVIQSVRQLQTVGS